MFWFWGTLYLVGFVAAVVVMKYLDIETRYREKLTTDGWFYATIWPASGLACATFLVLRTFIRLVNNISNEVVVKLKDIRPRSSAD